MARVSRSDDHPRAAATSAADNVSEGVCSNNFSASPMSEIWGLKVKMGGANRGSQKM
jgi:hypothetical protein